MYCVYKRPHKDSTRMGVCVFTLAKAVWSNIASMLMVPLFKRGSGKMAFRIYHKRSGCLRDTPDCPHGHCLCLSTGAAGEGRLCPSAPVPGHIWMETHVRAADSSHQDQQVSTSGQLVDQRTGGRV